MLGECVSLWATALSKRKLDVSKLSNMSWVEGDSGASAPRPHPPTPLKLQGVSASGKLPNWTASGASSPSAREWFLCGLLSGLLAASSPSCMGRPWLGVRGSTLCETD